MIKRRGIPGLFSILRDLGWVKLSIGGGGVLLLLLAIVFLMSGGDDSGGGAAGVPDDGLVIVFDDDPVLPETPLPDPSGGVVSPVPALDPSVIATQVAEQVAATVVAMAPTPTIVPTPDIPATVQAQILGNRGGSRPVVVVNPLDTSGVRNPYLTQEDHDFLESLGEDLWIATLLYLRVTEIANSDFVELSLPEIQQRLIYIDDLLAGLMDLAPRRAPTGNVSPVVKTYGQLIEGGIVAVQKSVGEFRKALVLFEDSGVETVSELGGVERERLKFHYLQANEYLLDFYAVMSSYGCSICGELFRGSLGLE